MRVLYVDNFRGFSHTVIPICNVNFLVGENSTGKTSILSLLKLLSDPRFWLHSEFNSEEVELGNFEDIVSVCADNRKEFTIGFCRFHLKRQKANSMYLILFRNEKGIPQAKKYTYLEGSNLVHVRISPKSIHYRIIQINQLTEFKEMLSLLDRSVNEHGVSSSKGYKKISTSELSDFPLMFNGIRIPLGFIRDFVNNLILRKASPGERIFSIPSGFEPEITWIAPIREKPKRTYDQYKSAYSSEGSHTPYLLNEFLGDRSKRDSKNLLKALETYGIDSGLFKSLQVKRYGVHNTSPFEIDVLIDQKPLRISNVGYGVSQVLPIIVEGSLRVKDSCFAIQQPEVHLHPKAQASLGGYIYSLAKEEGKQFLIETHSDFLIDRFRIQVSKSREGIDSQVLFFHRTEGRNVVYPIEIEDNGNYSENQPPEFREFFLKEELSVLDI